MVQYLAILWLILNCQVTWAFQDIYEPDETVEEATIIRVDNDIRQQHTLHNQEDYDWFKFYGIKGFKYEIIAYTVGADIDVVLELYGSDSTTKLERINDDSKGKPEGFSWRIQAEGWYFIKVSDFTAQEPETCRKDIQYELRIKTGVAIPDNAILQINIKDANSGQDIDKNAIFYTNCHGRGDSSPSGLPFRTCSGLLEVSVVADGYQTLNCQMQISPESYFLGTISLWPNGHPPILSEEKINFRNEDTLKLSQETYHNGDNLRVEFELHNLKLKPNKEPSEYLCARYYVGIAYPDGNLFIIRESINDLNDKEALNEDGFKKLELLNPASLPYWSGEENVVIEQSVNDSLPRGEYLLYLLRMPQGIDDPVNNLDKGELNVKPFQIK